MTWNPMCEVYCLFSACEWFLILMSYSNIWPIGKKIKSLNWTIMLWKNTLNIVQPGVIDWIKYGLCFYVQGHVLNLQTCAISGPLNLLSLGLCTCLLTPGCSCPRHLPDSLPRLLENFVQLCFQRGLPDFIKNCDVNPCPQTLVSFISLYSICHYLT